MIETAAEALSILSDEAPDDENTDQFVRDRAMRFRGLAERYFSLVNVKKTFIDCMRVQTNPISINRISNLH